MKMKLKIGDYCVYKTHGVCKIQDIKTVNVLGKEEKCLVLYLEKDRTTVTIPYKLKDNEDIRNLLTIDEMEKALRLYNKSERKTKNVWNRRAKEYRDKINSGSIPETVDVLRNLLRDIDENKSSFSERMIYDLAVYRLASEYSIIKKISYQEAEEYVIDIIKNSNIEDTQYMKKKA